MGELKVIIPRRRRRELPIDSPDFGHVMLGAALLGLCGALLIGCVVWFVRSH
jgi:hypothetical protein